MSHRMSVEDMMSSLRRENINTWFDLGIFLDRFKETKPVPTVQYANNYNDFKEIISKGGIAFITFLYSVDGVTIEVEKYAKVFQQNFPNVSIHYIAGKFYPESEKLIDPNYKKFECKEIRGFDEWPLYKEFFFTKLQRGSKIYNKLIIQFWNEVLKITEKLGRYIEQNNISLLYLINVCSNPGNVSLSLASIFISEYLGLPVINNNHDYYWEGGNKETDRLERGLKEGPRDFFFTNADVGEVFSVIEMIFPWESRSWVNVNINKGQSRTLIEKKGHNPANVLEIGTAVDTDVYVNISKRRKINAFYQFEKILSRYRDALVCYSVSDVNKNKLVSKSNPKPILIGSKTMPIEQFLSENIIFLQPTRIIARKRIELGFKLVKRMFNNRHFLDRLKSTQNLKLTLIVTGPIAVGHYDYFNKLLNRFSQLLHSIDPILSNRLYLAFLFSELDKEPFKEKFTNPVGIPELYNIASLVLLPSKTEGRGLPIIEASACGTPIFCTRYFPQEVYAEVVGEHLKEKERLNVIEFNGKKISRKHIKQIIYRVLFPHKFTEEVIHNKHAVKKRFSLAALNNNVMRIIEILYNQQLSNEPSLEKTATLLRWYKSMNAKDDEDLACILNTKNRQYLPGYGHLSFMIYLKSLIDPSFFRVEQQEMKGFITYFAHNLLNDEHVADKLSLKQQIEFYNMVDNIFNYKNGELSILHDHSMSYRHRNRNYYPYQDFTLQELTGLVNLMYLEVVYDPPKHILDESSHFFTDWNLALSQLTSSADLAIDNRDILIKKLQTNIPIGIFTGGFVKYELEFFALQSVRSRLQLHIEDELTDEMLKKRKKRLAPVFIFANAYSLGNRFSKTDIKEYIEQGHEPELYLLYKHNILRIVESKQLCVGIHFLQMGEEAVKALKVIHDRKGFIISNQEYSSMMTDIIDIDRFHIGQVTHPLTSNILGIPVNSGFIQFVPAGMRTTLAYPTSIQTSKDFDRIIKSKLFKDTCKHIGEKKVFEILKKDAEENGSPVQYILEKLNEEVHDNKSDALEYRYISGMYEDKYPWNGVLVNVNLKDHSWIFETVFSKDTPMKVTSFLKNYIINTNKNARLAWNGGYILNPELVGKLGLPESYIGSPLGLLINNQKVLCPPLFNKSALLIYNNGNIDIKKVNSSQGISVSRGTIHVEFPKDSYNQKNIKSIPCYYDLMYARQEIETKDRVIVRIAGNKIKEVIKDAKEPKISLFPVGLTLSFPKKLFPQEFDEVDAELNIQIKGISGVMHAVEAGPYLVEKSKVAIDMNNEGWTSLNSIRTQAARLDYLDMRGPKIAIGISGEGRLLVLAINGRIRESVGATHVDMAEILIKHGAVKAMGFDPGGSSTIVIDGKTLNISPYNSEYEKNIFALSPEPRAVSNAVIGYIKEEKNQ